MEKKYQQGDTARAIKILTRFGLNLYTEDSFPRTNGSEALRLYQS